MAEKTHVIALMVTVVAHKVAQESWSCLTLRFTPPRKGCLHNERVVVPESKSRRL